MSDRNHQEIIREASSLPLNADLHRQYQETRAQIVSLYTQAEEWHGTGRYRYGQNGEKIDLLEHIATTGLTPQQDDWDGTLGETLSISLTQQRMYAAVYADMFQVKGDNLQYQYHDYFYWGSKFMRNIVKKRLWSILRHFPFKNFGNRARQWSAKVTKEQVRALDPLSARSDISENYPILVGIKENAWTPVSVAPYVNLYEQRSSTAINPDGITHIEVPLAHVEETQRFLAERGSKITVFPREIGEMYSSEFSEQSLIDGNPFRANIV